MGIRDLFSALGGTANDAFSGRNRLHKIPLFFLDAHNNLGDAEVLVPTNDLEFNLTKYAVGTSLDKVFSCVPSVEPQCGLESNYGNDPTWASSWFADKAWSPHYGIAYAIYPCVNGEWWHPDSPIMNTFSTTAGHHPFFSLYIFVKPLPLRYGGTFDHLLVVAAALDVRLTTNLRPAPSVLWMASQDVLLGSHGLVLNQPATSSQGKDEARGGRFFYHDAYEHSFDTWPHRVLVEPPAI